MLFRSVFHRRDADDGGGIDGVFAVRDGGDVKDGIRLGQGVVTGVVAERTFVAKRLGRVNVAFDDEVGGGQNGFQFGQNVLRPQLDKLLSLLQPFHRIRPQRFKPREQRAVRTIPFPNPDQRNGLSAQDDTKSTSGSMSRF